MASGGDKGGRHGELLRRGTCTCRYPDELEHAFLDDPRTGDDFSLRPEPLTDQQLGGLVMRVLGMLPYADAARRNRRAWQRLATA